MAEIILDGTDRKILELLQRNARIPNTELADEVGLTPAPCLRRVRRLEESGIIGRYVALLEPKKVGLGLMVMVMVTLDRQTRAVYDRFTAEMRLRPEVLECSLLLGDRDFLLKVRVADLEAYQHFYLQHLTALEGVRNINSMIVVSEEKMETALELG
ncbi:MAG: Lrp/AsnC family transcriptional regulator [Pseudopedobacter sp.]|nr:Lrp/AsnC family transcriptional regulator [Deinococcales bacterium]